MSAPAEAARPRAAAVAAGEVRQAWAVPGAPRPRTSSRRRPSPNRSSASRSATTSWSARSTAQPSASAPTTPTADGLARDRHPRLRVHADRYPHGGASRCRVRHHGLAAHPGRLSRLGRAADATPGPGSLSSVSPVSYRAPVAVMGSLRPYSDLVASVVHRSQFHSVWGLGVGQIHAFGDFESTPVLHELAVVEYAPELLRTTRTDQAQLGKRGLHARRHRTG
jgi:hypothetical protein